MYSPNVASVLLVEDEPQILWLLATFLRGQGFEVVTASNGREAIGVYRNGHPRISFVMMDLLLPDLDGREVLATLQAINPKVRCCFTTGMADEVTEEDLLNRGAVAVFKKPFSLPELAKSLRRLTQESTLALSRGA